MIFKSVKTEKGNVGVSYISQSEADLMASKMDANDCRNCYNCIDCHRCQDCFVCRNCQDCVACITCNGCTSCRNCTDCSNCEGCQRCADCSDCTNVLYWRGGTACKLLTLNNLFWPVATNGSHIQIGCKNYPTEAWAYFDDFSISSMDSNALKFWQKHREEILELAYSWEG